MLHFPPLPVWEPPHLRQRFHGSVSGPQFAEEEPLGAGGVHGALDNVEQEAEVQGSVLDVDERGWGWVGGAKAGTAIPGL